MMSAGQIGSDQDSPRDMVCDQFEKAWRAGERPRIEDYLQPHPQQQRGELLAQLLRLEWQLRLEGGAQPSVMEYCERFPADQPLVREELKNADRMADSRREASTVVTDLPSEEMRQPLGEADGSTWDLQPITQGEQIGRFRIAKLLGQGGFGQVYLGYDNQLQRSVAIKVPSRALVSEKQTAEEYLAEARTLAGLDHPHIVPVYDVGSTEAYPCFIVSKFIAGTDLATRITAERLAYRESAELAASVAEALHFAHRHKIVHRDIKPANILLDVDGKPYVTDFGIALKDEDFGKSGGTLLGTPVYMSPEQVRGEGHVVDGRSDIFSLGVVLYELLTGQRPFTGSNWLDVVDRIATLEARPPRQLDDAIPQELERICLKAMSKRAVDRYTTAWDLAQDLRRFLTATNTPGASPAADVSPPPIPSAEEIGHTDTLISCAQLDDTPLEAKEEGWVSHFCRNLKVRLEQLSGEPVNVVNCPMPSGECLLDDNIFDCLPSAKTIVSVVSPPFAKSEGCRRSVIEFWTAADRSGHLWIDDSSRFFKVLRTPLSADEVPPDLAEPLSQVRGFEFYEEDPQTGRVLEFHERFGAESRQRYYERVYDLAHEVHRVLNAMKKQGGDTAAAQGPDDGEVVFLAAASSDLQADVDKIRRELVARGHEVLPNRPLPLVKAQLESRVREDLARSSISIHPVGDLYGIIPEQADCSIIELQNRVAAQAAANSDLQRIIWIPKGINAQDSRQEAFLNEIRQNCEVHRGADIIQDNLETLKAILIEKLEARKQAAQSTASTTTLMAPRVYLICDKKDEVAIEPLEDCLFQQDLEVSLPEFDAAEAEASEIHRQNLLDCDGVLIYYGSARHSWVDIKLRSVLKASGYGRDRALAAQTVYIAPPFDRRKERFQTHVAEVVRQGDSFDPELLSGFVQRLKQNQESEHE
jgi:serine/threonine protein kinase